MENKILSVGIDIGTSTTQVIFSEIAIKNTAGSFSVPRVEIIDKKIVYYSKIYFTPLLSSRVIDLEKLKVIISKEYENAKVKKEDIVTGAVIITGETARKENAKLVLESLSDYSGDFVVATAGADLESILAGYGSGAAAISGKDKSCVLNFDIGGGTTNASVFSSGKLIDAYGINIGGRLIKFNSDGTICYVSEKIKKIIETANLKLCENTIPDFRAIKKLTDIFASILYKITAGNELSKLEEELFIEHGFSKNEIQQVTFSGGVAECIYSDVSVNNLYDCKAYADIGPLLGQSIKLLFNDKRIKVREPLEKIRATVIGAGAHSIKLSGSTIIFDDAVLPKKNMPIAKLFEQDEENYSLIKQKMEEKQKIYGDEEAAFFMKGPKNPSYSLVKEIAKQISEFYKGKTRPVVFLVENDFAKALGQTIEMFKGADGNTICIDSVHVREGDYIDIGNSIGDIVPVVVKTLIFKN